MTPCDQVLAASAPTPSFAWTRRSSAMPCLSLGLKRGDRVLMFLDEHAGLSAAFFGTVRAGLVPLLINLQTPPDLLQFYFGRFWRSADAEP